MTAKLTTEQFVSNARAVHGALYDYSKAVYCSARSGVIVICPVHGDWLASAGAHSGPRQTGCPACGRAKSDLSRRKTNEEFLAECSAAHGQTYTYEKTAYVKQRQPVVVTCRVHGDFKISPVDHLRGSGCSCCTMQGFISKLPATLYVLEAGEIVKVGITNRKPHARVSKIRKSSGLDFKIAASFPFAVGADAQATEKHVLTYLRKLYENPSSKFDGFTECFVGVSVEQVVEVVESRIRG